MKKMAFFILLGAFLVSGCTVRTYTVKKDRVDQTMEGNQGYIAGSAPSDYQAEKKFTQRDTKVVEIEFRNPIKFERLKKKSQETSKINTEITPSPQEGSLEATPGQETPKVDTYVVQKNDTLQKISARPEIYGTTKKWTKIFEANKDKLSAPDKIYPGQKLKIPRD